MFGNAFNLNITKKLMEQGKWQAYFQASQDATFAFEIFSSPFEYFKTKANKNIHILGTYINFCWHLNCIPTAGKKCQGAERKKYIGLERRKQRPIHFDIG